MNIKGSPIYMLTCVRFQCPLYPGQTYRAIREGGGGGVKGCVRSGVQGFDRDLSWDHTRMTDSLLI